MRILITTGRKREVTAAGVIGVDQMIAMADTVILAEEGGGFRLMKNRHGALQDQWFAEGADLWKWIQGQVMEEAQKAEHAKAAFMAAPYELLVNGVRYVKENLRSQI